MINEKCPNCSNLLNLKDRRGLIFEASIKCKHCGEQLCISRYEETSNSIFLGICFCLMMLFSFNLDLIWTIIISTILVVIFQGFVDVFCSLRIDDER